MLSTLPWRTLTGAIPGLKTPLTCYAGPTGAICVINLYYTLSKYATSCKCTPLHVGLYTANDARKGSGSPDSSGVAGQSPVFDHAVPEP